MAPGVLLLLLLTATTKRSLAASRVTPAGPFGVTLKGVKLPGGYMEIVHEERCSRSDVRLTCRSLNAFIFLLEAEYRADRNGSCEREESGWLERSRVPVRKGMMPGGRKPDQGKSQHDGRGAARKLKATKQMTLRGNYVEDEQVESAAVDLRVSLNRRCSGQPHCRYNVTTDHPDATYWNPATLRLKYACIPDAAVRKYCNVEVKVTVAEQGYIKTPGYPTYYPGGTTCGWTFRSLPGQRIVLTFHDLNIRSPEPDGSCVDVVRIRDSGSTLFEDCGTAAGVKVVSNSDLVTLDLVASRSFYPARGFLLHYQVLGCPDVSAPNGSYISNGTLTSRTFQCKFGAVFPDTKQTKRILECKDGKWNESVDTLPSCVASSAVILKTENEQNRLASLSGDDALGGGVRIGRGEDAVATGNGHVMDSAQSAMMKQADYVVDVVLPTVLIALLFVGNAIIVYIIFQYRKRKFPPVSRAEEMALRNPSEMVPQV